MTGARNPELEAAIATDVDDAAAYFVYADWLQAEGDPRGELISLQLADSGAPDSDRDEQVRQLLAAPSLLGDVDAQLATFEWQWGFLRSVRLLNERDWMDDSFDVLPLVQRIFAAPVAAFVRELRVGVIRWMENGEDVPRVLAEVGRLGGAQHVRTLRLGDMDGHDCDLAHHPLGKLDSLSTHFGALEELWLWGCDFELGRIDLPRLRKLRVETCGLGRANLVAVLAAAAPELEELTLWFGSTNYGGDCTVADLGPLLDGQLFPKLKRLGLMNAEFTDELCLALVDAPVVARLERLDLRMGTMGDDGARALAARGPAFSHLQKLDVGDNFLSAEALTSLSAMGGFVVAGEQKEIENDGEADYRYVTAGE